MGDKTQKTSNYSEEDISRMNNQPHWIIPGKSMSGREVSQYRRELELQNTLNRGGFEGESKYLIFVKSYNFFLWATEGFRGIEKLQGDKKKWALVTIADNLTIEGQEKAELRSLIILSGPQAASSVLGALPALKLGSRGVTNRGTKNKGTKSQNKADKQLTDEVDAAFNSGSVKSGTPLRLISQYARQAKGRKIGLKSDIQAAHPAPQAAMKSIKNYNPKAVLTKLLPKHIHSSMDRYWKRVSRRLAGRGVKTWTAKQMYKVVSKSIDQAEGLSKSDKASLKARLYDDIFVEHGLKSDDTLRVPYSK